MIGSLISWIIVGAIGGWLAGYAIERDTAFKLNDIILGIVGALLGGWLFQYFTDTEVTTLSPLGVLVAFIGALILAFLYEKFTGKKAT